MKRSTSYQTISIILTAAILIGACIEFYHVAWGTGEAVGQFSPKWFVLFILFVLFCVSILAGVTFALFRSERFLLSTQPLIHRIGWVFNILS